MANVNMIRMIMGIIGNFISLCLFGSPIPTVVKIGKQRSVEQFKPDPYLATLLNCMMWIFYGLTHPDSLLIITINGAGLAIEFSYIVIFFTFAESKNRKKIVIAVSVELVFMAIVTFVTLYFFHSTTARCTILGTLCVMVGIIMYGSPLTVMRNVITSKSVKYMPFYLSVANFVNGIVWSIYALLRFDPYILVPNGLGVALGAVQLVLFATYYQSTNWDAENDKPFDVEMSRH